MELSLRDFISKLLTQFSNQWFHLQVLKCVLGSLPSSFLPSFSHLLFFPPTLSFSPHPPQLPSGRISEIWERNQGLDFCFWPTGHSPVNQPSPLQKKCILGFRPTELTIVLRFAEPILSTSDSAAGVTIYFSPDEKIPIGISYAFLKSGNSVWYIHAWIPTGEEKLKTK